MGSKKKNAAKHQEKPKGQANGHDQHKTSTSTKSEPENKQRTNASPKGQDRAGKTKSKNSDSSSASPPTSRIPWRLLLLMGFVAGGVAVLCMNETAKATIEDVYQRHVAPQVLRASEGLRQGLAALQQKDNKEPSSDAPSVQQNAPEMQSGSSQDTPTEEKLSEVADDHDKPAPESSTTTTTTTTAKPTTTTAAPPVQEIKPEKSEGKDKKPVEAKQKEEKERTKREEPKKNVADKQDTRSEKEEPPKVDKQSSPDKESRESEAQDKTEKKTAAKQGDKDLKKTAESAHDSGQAEPTEKSQSTDSSQHDATVEVQVPTPDKAKEPVVEGIKVKTTPKTEKESAAGTNKEDAGKKSQEPSTTDPAATKSKESASNKSAGKAKEKAVDKEPQDKLKDKPADQKQPEKTKEKPAEKTKDKREEKDKDKSADQKPAEKIKDKSGEKPAEKPAEKAKEKPADPKPAEKTKEKPADPKPAEKNKEKPADPKPAEKTKEKPADPKPAEKTKEKQADPKPAEKTKEKPADPKPAEKTKEKPADPKPAEKTKEKQADPKPAEKTKEKPADPKPAEKTKEKQADPKPAEKTKEKPADPKPEEKTKEKPADSKTEEKAKEKPADSKPEEKTKDKPADQKKAVKRDDSYMKSSITNDADYLIRDKLDEADKFFKMGKYEDALRKYDNILRKHSSSPRAQLGRADTLDKLAAEKRSNELLEQCISGYDHLLTQAVDAPPELLKMAGRRLANRQQFRGWGNKAIRTLRLLTEKFPDDVVLLKELGVSHLMVNDNEPARIIFQNVLKKSPKDGFAKVHLGFIIKTSDNNNEGAIPLMQAGIDSQEHGTQDGRFFFHLGDAYQRLGRYDDANRVFKQGADIGVFLSQHQRSLYNVDKLTARPWWTPEQTGYKQYLKMLEDNWEMIRDEGLKQLDEKTGLFKPEAENLRERGEWKQLTMYQQGRKMKQVCEKVPKTCALIDQIPDAKGCRRGQVKFSVMSPGVHVWPHCGPTNCRLRAHLGLVIPEGPKIRVLNETRKWIEGKFIIIDDSFEHEVWHDGDSLRLILIVDFWHPEITERQKQTLPPV